MPPDGVIDTVEYDQDFRQLMKVINTTTNMQTNSNPVIMPTV